MSMDESPSIAASLLADGVTSLRRSVTDEPRGPLCGMGICFECRARVDGVEHQRTCQSFSQQTPTELKSHSFDIVIVGAGPAGLAAACAASESGQSVGVIDDNPDVGGQIWRRERNKPSSRSARKWMKRLKESKHEFIPGTQVIAHTGEGELRVDHQGQAGTISYRRLILATGARELFLPFPGWTLPNVMGAGGLQAMVKNGLPIKNKRVIVAGSGPLLLAVASYLRSRGANVLAVLEQAPSSRVTRFGISLLWRAPSKLWQGIRLRRGQSYRAGCWVTRADGDECLSSVTFTDGKQTWSEKCDYLACGFGLVPNLELPSMMGCLIRDGKVKVDEMQCALTPEVYCVGELTGIGGLEKSLIEGQIAGYVSTGQHEKARRLFRARKKARRFAELLDAAFALRDEVRDLPEAETIVCRCEDVTWERIRNCQEWREAKLQTRCGMGPCQGRVCGASTSFLLGWRDETSTRPPLFPVSVGGLLQE